MVITNVKNEMLMISSLSLSLSLSLSTLYRQYRDNFFWIDFLYKFLYKILYENKLNVIMEISMMYDGDHCFYIVDDHVYVGRDVNLVNKILVITF